MNQKRHINHQGFTLLELLVVMAIMGVMIAVLAPAFTSIKGGSDLTNAAYDIAGTLEQARAYAMANNTFVWVGIVEEDVTADASKPQTAGIGRVAMAVVASKDGTRGYDVTSINIISPAISGSNLVSLNKVQHFENAHLVTPTDATPISSTGGMARPLADYILGSSSSNSVTPFSSSIGAGQYSFTQVINYDPQGVARIQQAANTDSIPKYIEIGLRQAHGNVVSNDPNAAAIQINGMTGATRIYRP